MVLAFVVWTHVVADKGVLINVLQVVAVVAVVAAWWLVHEKSVGWAFVATCVTIATTLLGLFADLYPRLMVSTTSSSYDLTVAGAASGDYALKVMTVITARLLPARPALSGLDVLRVPRPGTDAGLRAGRRGDVSSHGPLPPRALRASCRLASATRTEAYKSPELRLRSP